MEDEDDDRDLLQAKARLFASDVVHSQWVLVTGRPPAVELQAEAVEAVVRRAAARVDGTSGSSALLCLVECTFREWWSQRARREPDDCSRL